MRRYKWNNRLRLYNEEERIVVGEIRDVEGIDSDTRIVSDIGEGDEKIEIMIKSTRIGEGRGEEIGSGEEVKGKDAGRTGEECGRDSVGSSSWP